MRPTRIREIKMNEITLKQHIRGLKELHHEGRHEALTEATDALQAIADQYDHILNSDEAYNIVFFSTGQRYVELSKKRERIRIKANAYWMAAGVLLDMRLSEHRRFNEEMQEDLK